MFTGYHSFITLGKQVDEYNCELFTLSRGGEQRGVVQSANMTCAFSKNAHEAHGPHVYWQAENVRGGGEAPPEKAQPCSSMLMPFGNSAHGIFSSSLMCPLRGFISAEK